MNRKEYKILFENWNKLLNERPYNPYQYSLSKGDNPEYAEDTIINSVWTFIQIVDPTPVTGIPDLYHSIKDFKNNKSIENALECVWNGVTLIPGLSLLKKIKDLNKVSKLPTKAHVLMRKQIKKQASNTFEKIKDGQDFLEGLSEQIDFNEEEKKRIKSQIDRLKEIEDKIEKSLEDLPVIDDSDYQRHRRKDNKGGHIH